MKAVTVAAGAALVSSVLANGPGHNLHQQLHARSGWHDWSNTTTSNPSATSVAPSSLSASASTLSVSQSWGEWDTTSVPADPVSSAAASGTASWGEWASSSSVPKRTDKAQGSSTDPAPSTAPAASTGDWAEWPSAPTDPAASTGPAPPPTGPAPSDPAAYTEPAGSTANWGEWSSAPSDPAAPPAPAPSGTWAEWSSVPSDPAASTAPAPATGNWAEWSSAPTQPAASTAPAPAGNWTGWPTAPTDPAASTAPAPSGNWAEWSSAVTDPAATTEPVASTDDEWTTVTTTIHTTYTSTIFLSPLPTSDGTALSSVAAASSGSSPAVGTSTVDSSAAEWSVVPLPVTQAVCVHQIITSYGLPTWYPTPQQPQPTDPVAQASGAWAEWSASASNPPAVETSAPVDPSSAPAAPVSSSVAASESWGEWATGASQPPAVVSSSSVDGSSSWGEWSTSASQPPAVETSAPADPSTWAAWSPSASQPPAVETSAVWSTSASQPPAVETSAPVDSSSWIEWSENSSQPPAVETSAPAASPSTDAPAFYETSIPALPSSSAAWSAPEYSAPAVTTASSESSSSASSSSAASWPTSSSSNSGSASISSNGNYFGMTYSPYTSEGGCKDASTVYTDISLIAGKGFSSVRVYSTDCNTLENVGSAAKSHNIKIILGVFISSTGISGAQQQVTDIVSWAQWDLVELIVVGNEAVFNGYVSASGLAGFISSSRSAFEAAGYSGLVSTTEPLNIWEEQGSSFCGVIDVVSANLYAFFNADTTAENAGSLIQAQIGILESICSGKGVYVMESGWPTAGNCNGVACPSPENQAIALKGIQATSGSKIVFFSFEDESWKSPGQFGVEQHWGSINVF
ncbi:hypothetical protein DV735_g1844, partial [Chaetothyriales sp. CBS 134920]